MKNRLISRISLAAFLLTLLTATDAIAQSKLERFENCQFIETDWCDGDSFRVKDASGKKFTIRLYGVDCVETHVQSNSDSTRLRSQRRYFGISNLGGNSSTSIIAAKKMGNEARDYVIGELKEPFTVITAWADARGDGRFKRYYGFITTGKGHDLAEQLVRMGHARAYGVNRSTIDGRSQDELKESLKDLEFQAATRRLGIWKSTDWDSLPEERRNERKEESELNLAKDSAATLEPNEKIDLNSAPRDEIMQLPGIGETLANRIIERRPYKSIDLLIEVNGIGRIKLKKIRPFLNLNK